MTSANRRATAPGEEPPGTPLISAVDLTKSFPIKGSRKIRSARLKAVDNLNLSIQRGETVALVGESGSGKTTIGRLFLRLIDADSGALLYESTDVSRQTESELRSAFRAETAMVFQNPATSLSPYHRIGEILLEPLRIQRVGTKVEREERVREMLHRVGIDQNLYESYVKELSGGQRQRVGIARALILSPSLVVADEPTSALDVSVQAQIINLLIDLKEQTSISYLFITHDLTIAKHVADKVVVLFLGATCEIGPPEILSENPEHPYTTILASMESDRWERMRPMGEPPSPVDRPTGCVFRTRCPIAQDICASETPPLKLREDGLGAVACHFAGGIKLNETAHHIHETLPPRMRATVVDATGEEIGQPQQVRR